MTFLNKTGCLAAVAVTVSLETLPHAHEETYRCSFEEGGIERTEILRRVADSFTVTRDWTDGDFKVEVVRETPSAIFLLEDFQHPIINVKESGSFLLRVIDRQSGGSIWTSQRFSESSYELHYRGACDEQNN